MVNKYIIVLIIAFSVFLQGEGNEFILPHIEEYQLDNGMRVLISPNYESPVVYINMWIDVGELDDPIDKPELGNAVFEELKEGTKKYPDKNQLKEKLFSLGSIRGKMETIDLQNDEGIIEHNCLKEDTKDCIEIFSEIVRHPTFPFYNKLMEKLTLIWAPNNIFANSWNSTWYHAKYMYNGLVSYFNPLKQLSYTRKDVINWYNEHIRPENITLMISGDVNYIYIKKLINEYFGDWEPNSTIAEKKEYNIKVTDNSGINVSFTSLIDETEARILILKKTTELNDFWNPAIQMALYVFIKDRREKIIQNIDMAGWMGYGWQQTNRMPYMQVEAEIPYDYLDRYYSELISEFENLSNNSITDEELRSAIITRINDYQNKIYDTGELNEMVQHYYNQNGYSLEKISQMIDDIKAVTLEDVNVAAKKVFDPNNFIMSIAGNQDSCANFLSQFQNIEYYEATEELR